MQYTTIGKTGLRVSRLCLGCMSFGAAGTMHAWTLDEKATATMVHHALDLGINFFDTANVYSAGTSETYLGAALRTVPRDKVVIASKVYFNPGRLSAAAIHREIDGSLKRLGTDYLDLYIIHRFDYDTPIEETMRALDDLVKAGKVRALGASAMYAYQFHNIQLVAEKEGLTPFSAMENHYNLLYREDERELIPVCRQYGVSLMPYSPLAAGHLARPTGQSDSLRGRTDRVAMGKIGWKRQIRRSSPRSKTSRSGTESRWRRRRLPGIGEDRCLSDSRCNERSVSRRSREGAGGETLGRGYC